MTSSNRILVGVTAGVAIAAAVAGCNGGAKFAETPPMPDAGVAVLQPPPPVVADAGAPPPAPAAPTPCDPVQTLAMTTAIQGRASADAPGMKADGAAFCAIVPEGQTYAGPVFLLQGGQCYTIVGQSLPGVTQLDMQLEVDMSAGGAAVAALGIKPILAVSNEAGPQAAIAPKNACFHWALPMPVPVRVMLKPRNGSGPVAAQVYAKKK
jgi:hypothetical protein